MFSYQKSNCYDSLLTINHKVVSIFSAAKNDSAHQVILAQVGDGVLPKFRPMLELPSIWSLEGRDFHLLMCFQ